MPVCFPPASGRMQWRQLRIAASHPCNNVALAPAIGPGGVYYSGGMPDGSYALRVRGTSMIDDHIDDGDLVVVRPQQSVDNGDIAVAIVSDVTENGGATLKRFYLEGDHVRLQPRNPAMQPIIVPADQVEVRGKVVKLLRDL